MKGLSKVSLLVLFAVAVGGAALLLSQGRSPGRDEPTGGVAAQTDRTTSQQSALDSRSSINPDSVARQAPRLDARPVEVVGVSAPVAVPLSEDIKHQAMVIEETCGLVAGRVARVALENPTAYQEIIRVFESVAVEIGSARSELTSRQSSINEERILRGGFEVAEPNQPRPAPMIPGEVVHTSIAYDRALGKDVRRVVRIRPGEDAKMDELSGRLSVATSGANRVMGQLLTSLGY